MRPEAEEELIDGKKIDCMSSDQEGLKECLVGGRKTKGKRPLKKLNRGTRKGGKTIDQTILKYAGGADR